MRTDTIAAIATAVANAGIGIVRISGEEAFAVIDKVYRPRKGEKKLSLAQSHTVHYGYICDGEKIVDEAMVLILRAPNTYTREDTVEIDCHGGALVLQRVLETVVKHGARTAEPGEFTKRAFLNGRIDLSQAESVMDLIQAKNDFALASSVCQLQGQVKEKISEIRQKILYEIAFIESVLDDPEHSSFEGHEGKLMQQIEGAAGEIQDLLLSSENGALLKEGIHTVIVGKPNVGKSSLMNVLVGRERAIVTEIAGTTRDILEEQINLNGISLNIVDTAGIRDTVDQVEKIGVARTEEYLARADFVIYVIDASVELDENDERILGMLAGRHKAAALLNKSDLVQVVTEEDLRHRMEEKNADFPVISISAKERTGIRELEHLVKELFLQGEIQGNDQVYITNIRQKSALQSALESLQLVKKSIGDGMPEDFYSIDLMDAYESLGSIIGESVGEDVIHEIFSKFCMGK